jgi:fatty acid desaturase
MEDNRMIIESLLERVAEYCKTNYELVKLKVLDKALAVVSSFISHSVVFFFVSIFILFFSLGIAIWLSKILGDIYYGFFVVAAFYGVTGIIIHFLMHKWIKKIVSNYIIKKILK